MDRCNAQRRSNARRTGLRRSGQAEQSGGAVPLSRRRAQAVQQHRRLRNADARCSAARRSGVTEGGAMNLLGKLSFSAIPFDQPIIMVASALMILAVMSVLAFITLKGH